MADMVKLLLNNASSSGSLTFGGTVHSAVRALDERQFRRIVQFNNKIESWKEWRTHFMTAVRESLPVMAQVRETAEARDVAILCEHVLAVDSSYQAS